MGKGGVMRSVMLIVLAVFETASAGFEHRDVGGRSRGLGGAFTGLSNDAWGIIYNAGGLSQLTANEVSWYYSPQFFGVRELSYAAVVVAVPTSFGVLGLSGSRYGFDLYREFAGSISYARQINGIGIGVNLFYYSVGIKNYGSAGTIGIDAGVHVPVAPRLSSGFAMRNFNAPAIGAAEEKLPQKFAVGLAYTPLSSMVIAFDYQKESGSDASPRLGFEYWLTGSVALRVGVSDEPQQSSGGVGFRDAMMEFDYAFSRHPELGWSHHASVTLQW